jgi:peptide chain release factor 1
MTPILREQFERLAMRLSELDATLTDPQVSSDVKRYRAIAREQAEVADVVSRFRQYQQRERDRSAALEMLSEPDDAADPQLAEMAQEEITASRSRPRTTRRRTASRPAPPRPGRRTQRLSRDSRGHWGRRVGPLSLATWRACTSGSASGRAGAPRS